MTTGLCNSGKKIMMLYWYLIFPELHMEASGHAVHANSKVA